MKKNIMRNATYNITGIIKIFKFLTKDFGLEIGLFQIVNYLSHNNILKYIC